MGAGLLIYAAARRTDVPWTCLIPALYVLALAAYWDTFQRFLRARPRMAAVIAGVAVLAVLATYVSFRVSVRFYRKRQNGAYN